MFPLIPIIGIGLGILSAVVNTTATISANNYQIQVLERNRALMEENAVRSVQASQENQLRQDQQTRALLGEQLAAQSASGLKISGKSQMLTRKSARQLGRLDALNVREQGDIDAFNFRQMALDNADEIKFLHSSNQFALLSGFLDAASAGITGLRSSPTLLSSLMGGPKPGLTASGYLKSGVKIGGSSSLRLAR